MLDPVVTEEASRLWAAVQPANGDPRAIPISVMAMLASLHLARYQALPEAAGQQELRTTLGLFDMIVDATPKWAGVDAGILSSADPRPTVAEKLNAEGARALNDYQRTGHPGVLDDAIAAFRAAVAATSPGHRDYPGYLSNLAISLRARFDLSGDRADLDAVIGAVGQAVTATPAGDPGLAGRLSYLGDALRTRSDWTRNASDLDAAIDADQRAVAVTPPGNSERLDYLSNLGASLRTRFQRARDIADLAAAIDVGRQAVESAPSNHPNRGAFLSHLGLALLRRFEWAGNVADLDAAIDALRQAVAVTAPSNPFRGRFLSNLCGALHTRFEHAGDDTDLDAAIDAARQAVAAFQPGSLQHNMSLSNLATSLRTRFTRTGDPLGHPARAAFLSNLAGILGTRFEETGDSADLDAVLDCLREASGMPTASPKTRLAAAQVRGAAAAVNGRIDEAAEGFKAAVGLLPEVAWHGLDRAARQEQLAQWTGLAADAAACTVLDGRPELAVELLEQGRSVLWAQALNLRTGLTRLAELHPHLAERLESIRKILDTPVPDAALAVPDPAGASPPGIAHTGQQQDPVDLRRRLAREWDQVLAEVRTLDGFEHFLAAIPYPELAAAAAEGPVVIVNTSRHGCHALLVDPGAARPRIVGLPEPPKPFIRPSTPSVTPTPPIHCSGRRTFTSVPDPSSPTGR